MPHRRLPSPFNYRRGCPHSLIYPDDQFSFAHAMERCVGVGRCRKGPGGTMCPSYMVPREEKHATRGRARLEFMAHYYEGRIRPRHAYAFGLIHGWARLASLMPGVVNFLTQTPGLRELLGVPA